MGIRHRTPEPAFPCSPRRQPAQVVELVRIADRQVGAPAQDAWEANGHACLVAAGALYRFEGEFEHVYRFDGAHGAEAFDGMRADPAVELVDLAVVESGIGLG